MENLGYDQTSDDNGDVTRKDQPENEMRSVARVPGENVKMDIEQPDRGFTFVSYIHDFINVDVTAKYICSAMGRSTGVHSHLRRLRGRTRQRLALSVSLLQKWRRYTTVLSCENFELGGSLKTVVHVF